MQKRNAYKNRLRAKSQAKEKEDEDGGLSEGKNIEDELSYIPVSFSGMVTYLSYKVLREKLLKVIQEGTQPPLAKVAKLFELFRLSKIYQKDEEEV